MKVGSAVLESAPRLALPGLTSQKLLSWRHQAAPWIAAAFVMIWAGWAVVFNSGQFGDNIEQFNWAHSLQWGYHKHPPMPTWMLGAMLYVFGPFRWAAIALAALCFVLTGWLTWMISKQLMGARAATAVALLWGLQQCFSTRAQLYNHNTALVLFVAATVWAALQARHRSGWWLLTGLFAGAALLSKYQAVVPLSGLIVALAWTGRLRSVRQRLGLAVAMVIATSLFAPHMAWVASHDFTTLRYAGESVEASSSFAQRLVVLIQFVVNQVRMLLPAFIAAGVCVLWARLAPRAASHGHTLAHRDRDSDRDAAGAGDGETRVWLIGLLGLPLAWLAVLDLAGGVSLRNHWGVQTTQFAALYMVHRWQTTFVTHLRKLACIAVAIQTCGLVFYISQHLQPHAYVERRRIDSAYPGQRLTDAAVANWQSVTSCPLRYISGDSFPAGLISLYSGGTATVFEGRAESPWVDAADMRRSGALVVIDAGGPLPPDAVSPIDFVLSGQEKGNREPRLMTLAVLPPMALCGKQEGAVLQEAVRAPRHRADPFRCRHTAGAKSTITDDPCKPLSGSAARLIAGDASRGLSR